MKRMASRRPRRWIRKSVTSMVIMGNFGFNSLILIRHRSVRSQWWVSLRFANANRKPVSAIPLTFGRSPCGPRGWLALLWRLPGARTAFQVTFGAFSSSIRDNGAARRPAFMGALSSHSARSCGSRTVNVLLICFKCIALDLTALAVGPRLTRRTPAGSRHAEFRVTGERARHRCAPASPGQPDVLLGERLCWSSDGAPVANKNSSAGSTRHPLPRSAP